MRRFNAAALAAGRVTTTLAPANGGDPDSDRRAREDFAGREELLTLRS